MDAIMNTYRAGLFAFKCVAGLFVYHTADTLMRNQAVQEVHAQSSLFDAVNLHQRPHLQQVASRNLSILRRQASVHEDIMNQNPKTATFRTIQSVPRPMKFALASHPPKLRTNS